METPPSYMKPFKALGFYTEREKADAHCLQHLLAKHTARMLLKSIAALGRECIRTCPRYKQTEDTENPKTERTPAINISF